MTPFAWSAKIATAMAWTRAPSIPSGWTCVHTIVASTGISHRSRKGKHRWDILANGGFLRCSCETAGNMGLSDMFPSYSHKRPCHIVDERWFFIFQCLTLYIICIYIYTYRYNYKSVKFNTLNSIACGLKHEKSICLQQLCYRWVFLQSQKRTVWTA